MTEPPDLFGYPDESPQKHAAPSPSPSPSRSKAKMPALALEVWRALHDAAAKVRDIEPWRDLADLDLFGLEHPRSGEICVGSVCGQLGQYLAVNLHLPPEGVAFFWPILEGGEPDFVAAQIGLRMIEAEFVLRNELEAGDLAVRKELGAALKQPRGARFAKFRSRRPGFAPWYLEEWEARLLTDALEVACEFHSASLANSLSKPRRTKGSPVHQIPVFRRGSAGAKSPADVWQATWEPFPAKQATKPLPMDDVTLSRLRSLRRGREVVQLGFSLFPAVAGSGAERPVHPALALAVAKRSGAVLGFQLGEPEKSIESLLHCCLAKAAEILQELPGVVEVRDRLTADSLIESARELGIKMVHKDSLPGVEAAFDSLAGAVMNGLP